jgi:DNA polymerase elongation subunit (family B)
MSNIKRLFFDIETSPNIGMFWSAGYKKDISPESIIKERAIICIAYKWAGNEKTHVLSWDENQDDKTMLEKFILIANSADELVGHNGDRFDLPWIRTRCLFHRIPTFPNYTTIDTLKSARSKFYFNSNKLDYIAKFLGLGQKIHTGYDLWKNIVLNKDEKALQEMMVYCENDVILLEKVYNELSTYIPAKTHHGVIQGEEKFSCPECGSYNMVYSKKRLTALGTSRIQTQCKECGKYHTISEKTYQQLLIHKENEIFP